MGTLSYTATVSLDGYVADADGDFDWSAPGDEVFRFHVDRLREVTAEVLGRRTYRLMTYWDADPPDDAWSPDEREFARLWQGLDRIVVSSTLSPADLSSERDRLLPQLDLGELRAIVDATDGEVEIFGPTTAGPAIRADLVEEFRFLVVPRVVGGGLRALPDDVTLDVDLVGQRRFGDVVLLHYVRRSAA